MTFERLNISVSTDNHQKFVTTYICKRHELKVAPPGRFSIMDLFEMPELRDCLKSRLNPLELEYLLDVMNQKGAASSQWQNIMHALQRRYVLSSPVHRHG